MCNENSNKVRYTGTGHKCSMMASISVFCILQLSTHPLRFEVTLRHSCGLQLSLQV